MYKTSAQMSISDFVFPYGTLDENNRWVKLVELIPWDRVDRIYAAKFVNNGAPAHPSRLVFGALIAKQMLKTSDEGLVELIAENPYLQYFIGLKSFEESCPFGASTMVAFRRRFSDDDINKINGWILEARDVAGRCDSDTDDSDSGADNDCRNEGSVDGDNGCSSDTSDSSKNNRGTIALDATVAPADITYPTDTALLNAARKKLEGMLDYLCLQTGTRRPRTYRLRARREFLNWSKSKKKTVKTTRKAIKQQLGYVKRDLGYVCALLANGADLSESVLELLATIERLYFQQLFMYEEKKRSVPNRIVSLPQPWVRPIVRGKAKAKTEFGAKVHISTEDGYARIEGLSFNAYSEADGLIDVVNRYRIRHGHWPEALLVDKLYRNRTNLKFCKEHGIRMSGPALGRPPKDATITEKQKEQEYKDACDRNAIEGVFGTTKTAYGLDPVKARLEDTSRTVIALAVLAFNLKKLLASSLRHFLEQLFRWLLGNRSLGVDARMRSVRLC